MPAGSWIDAQGVLHSGSRPGDSRDQEALSVGRPTGQPSLHSAQQDLETGRRRQGGFRFIGFPGFKWRSVIGFVVAVQFLMYVVSLWVVTPRAGFSLNPTGKALFKIGSSNSLAEMCAFRSNFPQHVLELRRWVVPICLHLSPLHILLNVYFECSCGPRIEERDSALSFTVLFFGAGLMGNLLSDAMGVNGVGGSTACYGIIGMDFATTYRRWPELEPEQRESVKLGVLQTSMMLLLWEIILWKELDHFGHLGGFIGGFLIVLGRARRGFLVCFGIIAMSCVWTICIHPPAAANAACPGVWASYA